MFKFLKITCDEATTICDKTQYKEASVWEMIKLNIHFLSCKICKLYTGQNNKMTTLFKMKSIDCKGQTHCMSDTDKDDLKKKLQETI